jgi:hypothetical protein
MSSLGVNSNRSEESNSSSGSSVLPGVGIEGAGAIGPLEVLGKQSDQQKAKGKRLFLAYLGVEAGVFLGKTVQMQYSPKPSSFQVIK